MEQIEKGSPAPALERGLAIIEIVAAMQRAASFTEIVSCSRIPKATANRLIKVLLFSGYLERDQDGCYLPGPKCHLLGMRDKLFLAMERHGAATVESLRSATSNTGILFYWNGRQTQALAKALHENSIVMQPLGNVSADLAGTPWGWLALAEAPSGSHLRRQYAELLSSDAFRRAAALAEAAGGCMVEPNDGTKPVRRLAVRLRAGERTVGFLALGGNPITIPETAIEPFSRLLLDHASALAERLKYDAITGR